MPDPQDLTGEFVIDKKTEEENPSSENQNTEQKTKSKAGILSNFCMYPENVTFENQDTDEKIILLVRRDLATNIPWIVAALALIFLPFLITVLSGLFTPFFFFSGRTILSMVLFYYLIIFGFILVEFALWYFNVGLVTNKRIIDFNLIGILYKQISETKLNLVEDVTYSQIGSIRSVFNYGDVLIQTAAERENFEFDRAPEPARIVKIIGDLIGGLR
jgi:hypothetical protein